MVKGENDHHAQFLLLPIGFQKSSAADVYVIGRGFKFMESYKEIPENYLDALQNIGY